MRLENLQTQDAEGRPQIRPMVEVLPHRIVQSENQIRLKSGWFSGCMPLGYLIIGIAVVHAWVLVSTVQDSGLRPGVAIAALVIIGEVLLAIWMFSKKTSLEIDAEEIKRQKFLALIFANPTRWSSSSVKRVTIVEQGTFSTRFQMFAPGIYLESESGTIDLGAHPNEKAVKQIAHSIATLLGVPLEDKTREGIFAKFRSGKMKLFLIAMAIAALLIALRWWFEQR